MPNVLTRAGVFAALVVALAAVETRARADVPRLETLNLKSGYSRDLLVAGARQVHLSMALDKGGSGSGTLTLDPNVHDEWGSTCIAIHEVRVQVRLVNDDGRAAKGRRLYELTPVGDEGKPDTTSERWFLVRPLKAGAWPLVFVDKDGKVQDVLLLESA